MFSRFFLGKLGFGPLPIWLLSIALCGATGSALGQETGASAPPTVAARAAVLMNPATGEILFAKEPHLRLPPASTTKVLTALVVMDRLDPNARVRVSPQAAGAPPSRVGLHPGDAALTQDLLYGLLLKSGNDAAETLAEAAGGSIPGFAELMNAKALQVGARNSHFMNPHGLPNDDHYSTAYDLALIFRQAIHYPLFSDIIATHSAALRIESGQGAYDNARLVPVVSHNRLLASYEGSRGGKTGFTFKARHCFVGEVDRGGIPLIVAVLNSPSRGALWQDARTLLDYGFAHYGLAPPPPVLPEPMLRMARTESSAMPASMIRSPTGQRNRAAAANDDDDDNDNDNVPVRPSRPKAAAKAKATPGRLALTKTQSTAGKRQNQPGKPVALAVANPKSKAAATARSKGKPAVIPTSKANKPPIAKVAARVEPGAGKSKNMKPRI
ncbi:MAG: D-alanyl-D-alanine carboxypeptidase [Candidatus Contendobacter sp.]|nr:D-alanyl-D-alanine carboxypeptidase [Candidatus Contendobacter sp.]